MATVDLQKSPLTQVEQNNPEAEVVPDLLDYMKMAPRFDYLIKEWNTEKLETDRRRRIRKIECNIEQLRASGKLKADEVIIGVRVIDENIKKEQPIFVNYLTQSRRLAIFDCKSDPNLKTELLETNFTKGMTYDGCIRNFFKTIDGAQCHGWDSVEVTFDPKKPLHCGVEHIGHENLLFPFDAKDLQACEFILRRFQITPMKLKSFVKNNRFNQQVVEALLSTIHDSNSQVPKSLDVYKCFIKVDGIVYVAWASLETNKLQDWLKTPVPLSLGRRTLQTRTEMVQEEVAVPDITTGMPVSTTITRPKQVRNWVDETESEYPIAIYLYSESEEQCITEQKGRVFYDLPWQEAQVALRSLFINGAVRASNVYGSAEAPPDGSPPKKMDLTLEHGCFYSQKMNFFHTDYPDPTILRAADTLDVRKAAEMGQMASAVINREDSRKTAKEIGTAEDESAKIASVSILLFSGFMRKVLGIAWYIVQSQAIQQQVMIVPISIPMEQMGGMQEMKINDPSLVNQEYDIKPAGDTDVVRRAERVQKRLMLVPLVQAMGGEFFFEFMRDILREMLPEDSNKYINLWDKTNRRIR